jgi:hypothetical protein
VKYLAVIDTGFKFKEGVVNPATGYEGDRCVLAIRQRNSRLVSSADEVVYYSVAERQEIFSQPTLKKIAHDLIDWGVSSEQNPQSLIGSEMDDE